MKEETISKIIRRFYPKNLYIENRESEVYLEHLVDFVFRGYFGLIKPWQEKEEIFKMAEIVRKVNPKCFLEIGTAMGGTLFLFSHLSSEDAIIISIDLPRGRYGGGYSRWRIPLYMSFSSKRQKIYLIRADSHSHNTLNTVKDILKGQNIDFIFIDGDHSYDGVKRDFEIYSSLVNRGIIAFHDIVPGKPELVGEVNRFWNEVKVNYPYEEIVKSWHQDSCGIGVLFF
ncbi:MAG: class I SAM-dependent methyltransferase [bacterium]